MKDKEIDLLMAWANHFVVASFALVATLYYDYDAIVFKNKNNIKDWIFGTLVFVIIITFILYFKAYQLCKKAGKRG